MNKFNRFTYCLLAIGLLIFIGCGESTTKEGEFTVTKHKDGFQSISSGDKLAIVTEPEATDYSRYFGKITELPKEDPSGKESRFQDLRSTDLSEIDLSGELSYLLLSDFDDDTIWASSDKMPPEFDIDKIKEFGKNPGLGVRELHEAGHTGKNIGIAIIDQQLLVNHIEYKDNLKHYEEIHIHPESQSQMHGPAVASIAVGKTVGVAPGADLYYIGGFLVKKTDKGFENDLKLWSQAIDRVVEINKLLEEDKKIRVISISLGFGEERYKEVKDAISRAKAEGIETIDTSNILRKWEFAGSGRNALKDPNDLDSVRKGYFWKNSYNEKTYEDMILVPMDARCTASPTGNEKYVFYAKGGYSWSTPYLAGLYALCLEVNPTIDIDQFFDMMHTTATEERLEDGKLYKVLNPKAMIEMSKEI